MAIALMLWSSQVHAASGDVNHISLICLVGGGALGSGGGKGGGVKSFTSK